jgi:hypothetical protein
MQRAHYGVACSAPACRPKRARVRRARRRLLLAKAAAELRPTSDCSGCSGSSDSAASGRAERCARTAPLPSSRSLLMRSWSSSVGVRDIGGEDVRDAAPLAEPARAAGHQRHASIHASGVSGARRTSPTWLRRGKSVFSSAGPTGSPLACQQEAGQWAWRTPSPSATASMYASSNGGGRGELIGDVRRVHVGVGGDGLLVPRARHLVSVEATPAHPVRDAT